MKKTDTSESSYEVEFYNNTNQFRIINASDYGKHTIQFTSEFKSTGFRSGHIEYKIETSESMNGVIHITKETIPEWDLPKKYPNAKIIKSIFIIDDELTKKCKQ
jgi:hypothetical protein